jgi:hybrid cluster-associated redox disulfide protein
MSESRIHRDLTVQAVLDTWPSTRKVFIARRMACVGCELAPFMTVADAAAAYAMATDDLEQALQAAAQPAPPTSVSCAAIRTPEPRQ